MSECNINGEQQEVQLPDDLPVPEIPRCLQLRTMMKCLTSYAEAKKLDKYHVAAHALVWAPQPGESKFGQLRAAVMMHMRFDGTFGFLGGLMNEGEDVLVGLNREMFEECGWSPAEHPVTWKDYYDTQVLHDRLLVMHFFMKEITLEQFVDLEKSALQAREYGDEVLGSVRVPLYTMPNMYNGLPAFLNHKFVGTAKQQLLLALHHLKLFTEEEIADVINKSQNFKLSSNRF